MPRTNTAILDPQQRFAALQLPRRSIGDCTRLLQRLGRSSIVARMVGLSIHTRVMPITGFLLLLRTRKKTLAICLLFYGTPCNLTQLHHLYQAFRLLQSAHRRQTHHLRSCSRASKVALDHHSQQEARRQLQYKWHPHQHSRLCRMSAHQAKLHHSALALVKRLVPHHASRGPATLMERISTTYRRRAPLAQQLVPLAHRSPVTGGQ